MFEYIKGILTDKISSQNGFYVVVENGGIGYKIETSEIDYTNVSEINSEVKIYTTLIHREDTMFICGFLTKETRDIFNIITSVSGVGVKMGFALLSKFDACNLISIVINENYKELTLAKGVGVKLAQKIILELRDKLIKANIMPISFDNLEIKTSASEETFAVLQSLGYESDEIKTALSVVSSKVADTNNSEEVLRECLKYLSM